MLWLVSSSYFVHHLHLLHLQASTPLLLLKQPGPSRSTAHPPAFLVAIPHKLPFLGPFTLPLARRHRSGGVGDMARFFKDLGTAPDRGEPPLLARRSEALLASLAPQPCGLQRPGGGRLAFVQARSMHKPSTRPAGRSFYQQERQRHHLAALVEAGRHAGRSRVEYMGRNIKYHLFTKGAPTCPSVLEDILPAAGTWLHKGFYTVLSETCARLPPLLQTSSSPVSGCHLPWAREASLTGGGVAAQAAWPAGADPERMQHAG